MQLDPVVVLDGCGGTAALLLLGKAFVEALHIDRPALLGSHKLSEVDGEAIGVEQLEGESAVDDCLSA